jgi:hypothetical protein
MKNSYFLVHRAPDSSIEAKLSAPASAPARFVFTKGYIPTSLLRGRVVQKKIPRLNAWLREMEPLYAMNESQGESNL